MTAAMRLDPPGALTLEAPAKINWHLEILGKRADGFHDISTVMQRLVWCDRLTFSRRDDGALRLSCSAPELAVGDDNLVLRAARLLRERYTPSWGADIALDKRLPISAGLGGGSSDAAATLAGLSRLWELNLSGAELAPLGAELGSDIPFFLGTTRDARAQSHVAAHCGGRGEKIAPLTIAPRVYLLVLWPGFEVSTAAVYRSGHIDLNSPREDVRDFLAAFQADPMRIRPFNRLTAACFRVEPRLKSAFERFTMLAAPRATALSGSGSSMFALCRDGEDAQDIAKTIASEFPPPCVVKATATRQQA